MRVLRWQIFFMVDSHANQIGAKMAANANMELRLRKKYKKDIKI